MTAAAIGVYGVPMSSFTDNGLCARRADHKPAAFQAILDGTLLSAMF